MCFDASLIHFLNAYLSKRTECERHKKDSAKDMSWTHKAQRDGRGCLWWSAAVRGQARTSGSAGSDTASGPWSACFLWLWTQMYQNNWSKKQASTHKNITRAKMTLLIHSGASNDHTAWAPVKRNTQVCPATTVKLDAERVHSRELYTCHRHWEGVAGRSLSLQQARTSQI